MSRWTLTGTGGTPPIKGCHLVPMSHFPLTLVRKALEGGAQWTKTNITPPTMYRDGERVPIIVWNGRGVPGVVFLHPANGGLRAKTEAAIFQDLGHPPGFGSAPPHWTAMGTSAQFQDVGPRPCSSIMSSAAETVDLTTSPTCGAFVPTMTAR